MKFKIKTTSISVFFLILSFIVFFAVSYVTNVVKLVKCDFKPEYKEEIVHSIGLVVPPLSMVTAWVNLD